MSPKDIRHYKFLKDAIVNKYRNAGAPNFQAIPYDPYIFRWASNTFYELKLFDYLDIRERAVLVRLYGNLKKDPRLKFLDDPDSLQDQGQFELPESFHAKIASEQAKLSAQVPQAAPAGGSVGQSAHRLPKVSFGAGNVLRNFSSQSQIFLKRNVFSKVFTSQRLVTGFTTILGGIAGAGFGPLGAFAGAGAGFLTPSYVKTFGARHLGGLANWSADSLVRLSSQTSRFSVGGVGGRSMMGKRVAIAAILLFFGVGALAAFAPLPGQQPPVGTQPFAGNVGVGGTTPLGPVPQQKLDRILYWASIINNTLEPGNPPTKWNRMVQNITNGTYTATTRTAAVAGGVGPDGIYWCTNLVIDSYNLSTIAGLGPLHQLVRNMLEFWNNPSVRGYFFIPFNGLDSLRQARAGYALFRIYPTDYNFDHVSIIKSVTVDHRGNGSIYTLDSNSLRGWSSTIEGGNILDTFFLPDIVGFGGIR